MTETLLPSPTKTNSLGGVLPYGTTQDPVRDPGRSSSVVEIHRGISTIPGRPGRSAEGFEPLFGWPGGNRIRAPLIASLLKSHGTYIEPFVGGGSVAFRKMRVDHEVLGDIRSDLINCYTQVRDHVDWMIERGRELEVDREIFQSFVWGPTPRDQKEWAARFLYVVRYSRDSDLIHWDRKASNVGTFNETRLRQISGRLQGVHLFRGDFEEILRSVDGVDVVAYVDPPFRTYLRRRSVYSFREADWFRLREVLGELDLTFYLRYYDNAEVRALYEGFRFIPVPTVYHNRPPENGRRRKESEILVTNDRGWS